MIQVFFILIYNNIFRIFYNPEIVSLAVLTQFVYKNNFLYF